MTLLTLKRIILGGNMNYKPLENIIHNLTHAYRATAHKAIGVYRTIDGTGQTIAGYLFPNSGLEFVATNGMNLGYNPTLGRKDPIYGTERYLLRKKHDKSFDARKGTYEGTNKRPHGETGNNEGIRWRDVNDPPIKAKKILDAAGLQKNDPRYRRTQQPTKADVNWARQQLKGNKR